MFASSTKPELRKEAAHKRATLKARVPELSRLMAQSFLAVRIPANAVVSAYVAIGDEADPAPLIAELRSRGRDIALPRVVGRHKSLDFHRWDAGADLVPGGFGLSEPSREWPRVDPDVLVVPLLAFNPAGYRLGYGAGYYDMTLRRLRAMKPIVAVGFAFAAQEFPSIPHCDHDERLDWIVTETGARKFA